MKLQAFSKTYQNQIVLSFPNFTFRPGTVYAVIGANGCGKSTFARIVSGTLSSDTPAESIHDSSLQIGYLPQKPYAFHMSLLKNLMINASSDKEDSERHAAELMEALSLTHLKDKKASSFSGGESARMALARLMMKDYNVLLLDEPCAAMDIPSTLQTEKLIRDYCTRTGATIILITHSLQQAKRVSDEVLFFYQGELMESGATDSVIQNPQKEETRQFLDFFQ